MEKACCKESAANTSQAALKTLPGDDVRQIMWRYADRFDLQMAVQSTRQVARGLVARLVANGARNTHEWTKEKAELFSAFDQSGITAVALDPEHGGFIEGPKNLALALVAFELSWVDGGAATCSLATNLALAPINERGTKEQRELYMKRCAPANAAPGKEPWRGAFALTEPLPYIGVDTGIVGGKIRVAEWKEGSEPMLQVEKRGRFITNMDFATFVTAAVTSDDPKIKGSCMVILELGDPGLFDRGAVTKKMVHQLSSTRDPIFNLKVPANRIIGGYTIKDGVIVPNYTHSEVIEAVFMRTRVAPGLMTSAKLLSAIEPIIRYQRQRFHGSDSSTPGTPRYDLGLQQKEDALLRLSEIWATGEASASLGFETARKVDEFEPVEKEKDRIFAEKGIKGPRAQMKALAGAQKDALELVRLMAAAEADRDQARIDALNSDPLVKYVLLDAVCGVLCPACKLWNTGHGTNMMREAVSLMGGYGITEDCPGFLGNKWMDAQLEATYEGPEAVQRRHLTVTMTSDIFLAQFQQWMRDLRKIAEKRPGTGACALASAGELWLWSIRHILKATDADGRVLFHGKRQGVTFPMADALCWIIAARCLILDVIELEEKGPMQSTLAEGLEGFIQFYTDLCHVQCGRAAGEVSRVCTELVFGYNRHPAWDGADCFSASTLDGLESTAAGISSTARSATDVVEADGSHNCKAGPCAGFNGIETFRQLHSKLACCLTGARLAKDKAASALTGVMIPEALDYPM